MNNKFIIKIKDKKSLFLLKAAVGMLVILLSFLMVCACRKSADDTISPYTESQEHANQDTDKEATDTSTDTKDGGLTDAAESGEFNTDGIINESEYLNYKDLKGLEVYWSNDSQNIFMALRAQTEGYISIGIQPGRLMKDADMVYGFVSEGSVSVFDMYSTGNFGPHPPDNELGGKNDIIKFGGSESDGYTIIEFQRLLSTGDDYDIDLSIGTNKIIWAYGKNDSIDSHHSRRGYGEIEIRDPIIKISINFDKLKKKIN